MSDETIPYHEAIALVGRALYGDDWVGSLSPRAKWLLEEYGERRSGLFDMKKIAFSRTLQEEVAAAEDRQRWMEAQYDKAIEWLAKYWRGAQESTSRALFEELMARAFGSVAPSSAQIESKPKLSNAPKAKILDEIREIYRNSKEKGIKPPNKKQAAKLVQPKLTKVHCE